MGSKYNAIAAPMLKIMDANGKLRDKIAAPYEVENALRAAGAPPCVIAEWVNEARRRLRRLSDARRGDVKRAKYPAIRIFSLIERGARAGHFYELRPTKGWKRSRTTTDEALRMKAKFKVPMLTGWPRRGKYADA